VGLLTRAILSLTVVFVATESTIGTGLSDNNGLSVTAGLEYQVISQEFFEIFINLMDTGFVDPIEAWNQSKDEINDLILRTNVDYIHSAASNRLNFLIDLELSGDRILGRGEGYYQIGNYDNNLKVLGKFETRSPYGSNTDLVQGYNYLETYIRKNHRVSDVISLNFKTDFRMTTFTEDLTDESDTTMSFPSSIYSSYDYSIVSGMVGGEFSLSGLSKFLTWQASYAHRRVPDSTEVNYEHYRVESRYSSMGVNGFLSLGIEFEHKNYMTRENKDDYEALGFDGQIRRDIGRGIETGFRVTFDNYSFSNTDLLDRDYSLSKAEFKIIKRVGYIGLGPLGRLDYRREKRVEDPSRADFSVREQYNQWEIGIQGDILSPRAMFMNTDLTFGYRRYLNGTAILTSYHFISFSLIANYSITNRISFNMLADGNLETHGRKQDNTNLYLISIGVSAQL
jgi:hypothetical protein